MARIRSIKPEFWTSEQVMACSPIARLMFIGLWNFCDDAGRMKVSPRTIKAQLFPADDMIADDVLRILSELSTNGLLELYIVDEVEYLQVTGWHHQKIDKPQKPRHPPKSEGHSTNAPRMVGVGREGIGEEGKGEEKEKEDTADAVPPSKYVFEAGVIRLTKKDFEKWRDAFPNLSLKAELLSLQEWAEKQPKWFHAVQAALAKRNREIQTAKDKPSVSTNELYWGRREPGIH